MFKKLIAVISCLVICMTMVIGCFAPMSVSAVSTSDYQMKFAGDGKIYAHGLDLSYWQSGNVNFTSIKNAGYDFVILRAGYSGSKDSAFDSFYSQAKAAGLGVGAYYYCYATYASRGTTDAYEFISWLSGKQFEYPVYLDFEDEKYQGSLSYATKAGICNAFLTVMENNGYLTGLYSMASWLNQSWVSDYGFRQNYEGWIAHIYGNSYSWGHSYATSYGMYQYTWEKYVGGLGPYDANVCYKDYPSIVKTYGFNGYSPAIDEINYTTYYYPACPASSETMYATMNSMGILGNYTNLKKMALANGYTESSYSGTAEQNTALLNLWKKGLLKNPNAKGSPAYPYAASSATSLSAAVGSFGFDNSANAIARIKIANRSVNETTLLNLMKKGELLQPTGAATVIEAENDSRITKTTNFTTLQAGVASNGNVLYSSNGGNLSLTFTGTKLDMITTTGPRLKSIHISVDGGEYKRVELGATSATHLNRLYSTGTLSNGTHTINIKCEGQVHIDAFEVFGGTLVQNVLALDEVNVIEAADTTKVQTNGKWQIVSQLINDNGKAIYTPSNGEAFFSFYGSQFKLNSFATYDQDKLYVSIDGGAEIEVDMNVEADGQSSRTVVYDSGILSQGIHNVVLRADGGAFIDSINIFGTARDTFKCESCKSFLDDVTMICDHEGKSVSDMITTYQNQSSAFSVVNTSTLKGGTTGVPADTAYLYNPASGTARKNGFAIKQPIKGDFYGNESNWMIDAWVYISDVSSYCMIMQFIPQSGLSMYSVKDSTKFNNLTENWAYRVLFTNTESGDGRMTLNAGWNHIQVPLSDVLLGSTGNDHNKAAYTHLRDMGGVVDAITFHENEDANYGKYDFAVASVKLVKDHTCEYTYTESAGEVEDYLDDMIISNNWVHRYNKNFSNKYALHTTQGGKVQFTFEGDNFSIVSYRSPSQGKLYVSIDGGEEFLAADLYDLVADTYFKETVYTSETLNAGTHTVTIRAEGKAVIDAIPVNGDIIECTTPIHDDVTIEIENILDAKYTGNWTKKYAWKLSAHNAMSISGGGSVTFDFEGDEFSLVSYKANTQGKLYISIDNGAETEVDLYDDSINTLYQEIVYTNKNLNYGTHTVTIRVQGNASLDSIIINRESAETVTYEAEDNDFDLNGSWKAVETWSLSNHKALQASNGATASFTYTGYDFKIISYKARTQGKMYVTVDGGAEIEIDLYEDSTDTSYKAIALDGAGLDYGTHTVTIRTEGKVIFDAVKIDGTLN